MVGQMLVNSNKYPLENISYNISSEGYTGIATIANTTTIEPWTFTIDVPSKEETEIMQTYVKQRREILREAEYKTAYHILSNMRQCEKIIIQSEMSPLEYLIYIIKRRFKR